MTTSCLMCQLIEGIVRGANDASSTLGHGFTSEASIAHMVRGSITIGMTYEKHTRFTSDDRSRFCFECRVTLAMAETAVTILPNKGTS